MIALAAQIRILFVLLVVGMVAYGIWRMAHRAAQDPRVRAWAAGGGGRMLRSLLLRGGLLALLRLLRWFR